MRSAFHVLAAVTGFLSAAAPEVQGAIIPLSRESTLAIKGKATNPNVTQTFDQREVIEHFGIYANTFMDVVSVPNEFMGETGGRAVATQLSGVVSTPTGDAVGASGAVLANANATNFTSGEAEAHSELEMFFLLTQGTYVLRGSLERTQKAEVGVFLYNLTTGQLVASEYIDNIDGASANAGGFAIRLMLDAGPYRMFVGGFASSIGDALTHTGKFDAVLATAPEPSLVSLLGAVVAVCGPRVLRRCGAGRRATRNVGGRDEAH
jgi:hypothetical protein